MFNKKIYVGVGICLISASIPMKLLADDLVDAFKSGKVSGQVNIRYEHVDDDRPAIRTVDTEGEAATIRTALKYTTGDFYKTFFTVEFENVTGITDEDDYFDGPEGTSTPGTVGPIIDPEGTEVNQAFLGLKPLDGTLIKVGRQIITPRKAPFHRYLGTVLWRQNYQTQDAVTVTNTSLPNTRIIGGYIWNNNFITGQDRDLEAPIFNITYSGFKYAKLEAYYYDINFTDVAFAGLGTETVGGRVSGAFPVSDAMKLIYAGEYATQSESDDAPTSYDADYYLIEGGFKYAFKNSFIKSLLVKASHEVLEADDSVGIAFRTPLGTNHAFQGWADNFLVTPGTGIEDTYFTIVATGAYDTKIIIRYDMFDPENDSTGFDEYGDEIGVWFTKTFNKKYVLGIKYADYSGDGTVTNGTGTATNGNPRASDLTRFWTYLTINF